MSVDGFVVEMIKYGGGGRGKLVLAFVVLSFRFNVVWVLAFLVFTLLCFPIWPELRFRG